MDILPVLKLIVEKDGSDLYFTTGAPVNLRVEGITQPVGTQALTSGFTRKIAESLMSPEQQRTFDAGQDVNFRYTVPELGNFRVNVFRQRGEVALVLRYIRRVIPTMEALGMPPVVGNLAMARHGLILVVGASGSGKSTTLASMVEQRSAAAGGHILTIEDPIEYQFSHRKSIVNQREIGLDTPSFSSALLNALREAPDLIVIGEIRDRETMQYAIHYAQTGHLCLATLHANTACHALARIVNFFSPEARSGLLLDLSVCLNGIVAQRLIRGRDGRRVAAVEVLMNTPRIADLIRTGKFEGVETAMQDSLNPEIQNFDHALRRLFDAGKITMEEAKLNTDSVANLTWLISNSPAQHVDRIPTTARGSG
jgi:twitching motility protein PilU